MTVVPIYDEPDGVQQQNSWDSTHHLSRSSLIVVTIFGVVAGLAISILSMYVFPTCGIQTSLISSSEYMSFVDGGMVTAFPHGLGVSTVSSQNQGLRV